MLATLYGILAQATTPNNGTPANASGISTTTWVVIAVVGVIVLWMLFRSFARRGGGRMRGRGYGARAVGPRMGYGGRRRGFGRRRFRGDRAA